MCEKLTEELFVRLDFAIAKLMADKTGIIFLTSFESLALLVVRYGLVYLLQMYYLHFKDQKWQLEKL